MITINEEKTLEKIQIVSWLKNSTNNMMLPQYNKGHTWKAYGLYLSMVKVFFKDPEEQKKIMLSPLLFSTVLIFLVRLIRQEK